LDTRSEINYNKEVEMVESYDREQFQDNYTPEFFYALDQITEPLAAVVKKIRATMRTPTKEDASEFSSLLR